MDGQQEEEDGDFCERLELGFFMLLGREEEILGEDDEETEEIEHEDSFNDLCRIKEMA